MDNIIAYDFGTGGIKASLFTSEGHLLGSSFEGYPTFYPRIGWHEQKPDDWWMALCNTTKKLIASYPSEVDNVYAMAISGHSLGVVPLGQNDELLRDYVPIWSDCKAEKEAQDFFEMHSYANWYLKTGNGFPAQMYSVFKLMWYKNNEPKTFQAIKIILGTKDYINLLLTGKKYTDNSYASGTGFYDLKKNSYDFKLLKEMNLPEDIFPPIVPSTHIIGTLSPKASEALGLSPHIQVACGGVDNSCMALGARGIKDGRTYTSLGSSAWIAVCSHTPVLDLELSPFVFAHIIPGMYSSATSIFSAGSSFQWVRNQLCKDLLKDKDSSYQKMNMLAAQSPIAANKLIFNPSLAGAAVLSKTAAIRGAYLGLDLKHTQADLIRSAMEGIALSLRSALDSLKALCQMDSEMLFVGGGSNSSLWLQIFADVYQMNILKTNIGQYAGSLGAAAIAAVGSGLWSDFSRIDKIHICQNIYRPIHKNVQQYESLFYTYKAVNEQLNVIATLMQNI